MNYRRTQAGLSFRWNDGRTARLKASIAGGKSAVRRLFGKRAGYLALGMIVLVLVVLSPGRSLGQPLPEIRIGFDESNPQGVVGTLQILMLLTVLSLAPAILLLMTSFTRIVVVLSFVRNALATQMMPPNQVLIGLALFLTFFTMAPVYNQVNAQAIQPYLAGQITQTEAINVGLRPIREFMLKETREKDLALFIDLASLPRPNTPGDVPTHVLIPAFAISELRTAFQIGFMIFVPFLVIDMVVASTLMSMGMLMLPPMLVSLPFKILLFVMVDGWNLITRSLVLSFH